MFISLICLITGCWRLPPGGVDQNIEQLPYRRVQRPMFPMDKDMKEPDLSARLVPASDEVK